MESEFYIELHGAVSRRLTIGEVMSTYTAFCFSLSLS